MDYRWLGAFHLIAAVIWISSLLLLAIAAGIYAGKSHDKSSDSAFLSYVRAWNRKVTSPAMLLLWLFGVILVIKSGGAIQPWLWVKLSILVLLSVLHGKLSKAVRQLATNENIHNGVAIGHGKFIILFSVAVIIILAKFKMLFF